MHRESRNRAGHADRVSTRISKVARALRRGAASNIGPQVIIDFPEAPALPERELDAIETYLGRALDQLLEGLGGSYPEPLHDEVGSGPSPMPQSDGLDAEQDEPQRSHVAS